VGCLGGSLAVTRTKTVARDNATLHSCLVAQGVPTSFHATVERIGWTVHGECAPPVTYCASRNWRCKGSIETARQA
jgi:hypothetical protein